MLRVSRPRRPAPARAAAALAALVAVACAATLLAGGWPPVGLAAALAVAVVGACTAFNLLAVGLPVSSPSLLFAAALTVFHLGLVVPWCLGWWTAPPWLESTPPQWVARALLCVALAFASFEVGLLAGWRRLGRRTPASLAPVLRVRRVPSAFHTAGMAVALVAVLTAFANVCTIGLHRFLETGYGYELYASTDSRFVQMGLYWLLPTGTLIALAGARPGAETVRALAGAAATILVLLWLGDRGGAVSFAASVLVVWTYTRGALPLRTAMGTGLGLLFLLPTVGAVRLLPHNGVTLAGIQQAAIEASPLGELAEMGATLRPLVDTLRLVPAQAPYRLGQSYFASARRIVPNVGLLPIDADWANPTELPPNHWITYAVEPWTWAAFGGLGYSAIAEPYLNFGVPGVVAYFLFLGLCLGRLDLTLAGGAPRRTLALAAVVFMPLLLTVRNDSSNFVRPAAWGVGIVLLVEGVYGVRAAPRRATRPAPVPRALRAAS
jgi:hypothetical protein